MSIRAIVFDIGGVLEITPDPQMTGLINRWGERLGLDPGEMSARLERLSEAGSLGTCTEDKWLRDLQDVTGMDDMQRDEFMADFWREYLGELNVELVEFLVTLRPYYQIALLSNSFLGAREREQERYHFQDLADFIIYSHEVGLVKPDPRIFQLMCDRLNLPPNETLFLDDYAPNIEAARALGMQALLFGDTRAALEDVRAVLVGSRSV